MLNPNRGRTGRATAPDSEGLAALWRWVDALEAGGATTGAHRSGVLRIAASARQRDLWRGLDGPQQLDGADFPSHVTARFGGMLVTDGGWLEPRTWLTAVTTAAVAGGAVVAENSALLALAGRGPLTATTARGTITAMEVVLCLGAYDAASMRLPRLQTAPGLAVTVRLGPIPADGPAPRPLAGALGIVFRGSTAVVSGTAHSGDAADVERLLSSAAWFVPGIRGAPVSAVWRGVRAKRPSGAPVVRRLRSGLTLFGGLGGRGFLCSALLAESLAGRLSSRLVGR